MSTCVSPWACTLHVKDKRQSKIKILTLHIVMLTYTNFSRVISSQVPPWPWQWSFFFSDNLSGVRSNGAGDLAAGFSDHLWLICAFLLLYTFKIEIYLTRTIFRLLPCDRESVPAAICEQKPNINKWVKFIALSSKIKFSVNIQHIFSQFQVLHFYKKSHNSC